MDVNYETVVREPEGVGLTRSGEEFTSGFGQSPSFLNSLTVLLEAGVSRYCCVVTTEEYVSLIKIQLSSVS